MSGNYARHAAVWDWAGDDRTAEFEFWRELAGRYGRRVLSIIAAIGESGAYMARKGFSVTAVDITAEMVDEGRRSFGDLANLEFVQADARRLDLDTEPYDFAFIGTADLHHMLSECDVMAVLNSICRHLRTGGGLGVELWPLPSHSWASPRRVFEPFMPAPDGATKVWKEGSTEYDEQSRMIKISQDVFVHWCGTTERFTHELELQLYARETLLRILSDCGYLLKAEYGDYERVPWEPSCAKWIVEATKD